MEEDPSGLETNREGRVCASSEAKKLEPSRIQCKESTSSMSDDEMKAEMSLITADVEPLRATGLLVDIRTFGY